MIPARHWKVFIFHLSHMDPGWHDLPERIMANHAVYLDQAIDLCEKTRDEPPERRFIWNIEHSWAVDYYERHRPKERFEKLMECCRRGEIELGAIYAGVHTDFCGHEELARLNAYAAGLRKRFGIRVDSAYLNDVSEGYTMGLPQVLARSGIRGIIFGPGVKAVVRGIQPHLPRIFNWTTPDGSSVLVAWTPGYWTYSNNKDTGFEGLKTIQEFEALGTAYPYDALFRHGGGGDNCGPKESMREIVLNYRKQSEKPDVRMARADDFISYVADHFCKAIPSFQGDNPQSWADGTLSLAKETGMHRRNQNAAIAAEKLAALDLAIGSGKPYPAEEITDVYRDLFLYSDHTWGLNVAGTADMDLDAPSNESWRKSWDAKRIYAVHADRVAGQVCQQAVSSLAAKVKSAGPSLIVWNTSSWPKSDIVRLAWDEKLGETFALVDERTGAEAPWQKTADISGKPQLVFRAEEVPALGYASYRIESRAPKAADPGASHAAANVLENEFYRITVDPKTGGVVSILDKELKQELVDAKAAWPLNQYIHAHVDEGYRPYKDKSDAEKAGTVDGDGVRYVPDQVGPVQAVSGPVLAALEVAAKLTGGPAPASITRRVVLYRGLKFIEFQNLVDKKASSCKEQIYFAFPFALSGKVTTWVEQPYAMMRWDRDILPGCWRGYSSVQHWLDVSGDGYGVTFSPLEAPVVSIGGINSNQWDPKWHEAFVPQNGHVFSYVMSNVWNCNYALWQGGPVQFAYRAASHRGACDTAQSASFGWTHAAPLLAAVVGRQDGSLPEKSFQSLSIDAGNVMATALKRADDGDGWIVRLYETGRKPATEAVLAINFIKLHSAALTNLVEENLQELKLEGNAVGVTLKANELLTIRVK